jgi:hypothetical protein
MLVAVLTTIRNISGKNFEENSAENFPPQNVEENWNFPRKKFQKIRGKVIFFGKSAPAQDL